MAALSGRMAAARLLADLASTRPVPHGGYAWWYVDGLSDDGRHGITLIAFIGSVFSPYYAWARRRGGGDPEHHCALNVALYGAGGKRWALTERAAPPCAGTRRP
jgi:carotenoid 1,2-hydratase